MIWTSKLIKRKGALQYTNSGQESLFNKWKKDIPENSIIEVSMEVSDGKIGTIPQLKKVHAMIRELSMHTGTPFQDMKLLVKDKAGLCTVRDLEGREFIECKSFGDLSSEELGFVIETCIEIGRTVNLNLT